uniref:Histidine-specific methyltransferase SAM-dependent domain-containing protein n=1 Tax=Bionectria ochroleuca TaxID=29856 RepID=A0A0B7JM92_BIOOC
MPAVKQHELVDCDTTAEIIDIRSDAVEIDLKNEVKAMIGPKEGPRMLPTLLLYDEKGLQLFEDITYLDEYYLTNYEIDVLKTSATDMASNVPTGAIVVELGSGNLRKIRLLLQAFEDAGKVIDYYALDLDHRELERTLSQLPAFQNVTCRGLHGTYDDGRDWLATLKDRPKCVIHMGSSIGNFHRDDAAKFLEGFGRIMGSGDCMFVGVDSCIRPDKYVTLPPQIELMVLTEYKAMRTTVRIIRLKIHWFCHKLTKAPLLDHKGLTHQFILNGLENANSLFGYEVFHIPDWKVIGEYVYDEDGGRHQAFVAPIRETVVLGHQIKAFERIKIEQSLKYSSSGSIKLWKAAGLVEAHRWTLGDEYGIHMLRKESLDFPLHPSLYAAHALPSVHDWTALWAAWEIVTRRMLPDQDLHEKPIKLRNACVFYLGHIPTFLDIQLTKTTGTAPTDPASYYTIFERGVDPDVDNPELCHQHSEIPSEWPHVQDILAYQERVRARLISLYKNGEESIARGVGRAIWLGFEHEIMHIETLLYMMLQSSKTLPPPHRERPNFEKLAEAAVKARVENEWFDIPSQAITIGLDDPEEGTDHDVHYGWDNEKPAREETVHAFQAKGRPITNEEYAKYMIASKLEQAPASWFVPEARPSTPDEPFESFLEGKFVRTVYGPVPLKLALDWPVRSIYAYADRLKKDLLKSKLANKVPAVNGSVPTLFPFSPPSSY